MYVLSTLLQAEWKKQTHTHTHTRLTALVRDYPGGPVYNNNNDLLTAFDPGQPG